MNIIAYMFYMMALWGYRNKDNVAINFAEVLSSDIAKLSPWLIEIEHGWLAYIEYAQVKRYKGFFGEGYIGDQHNKIKRFRGEKSIGSIK